MLAGSKYRVNTSTYTSHSVEYRLRGALAILFAQRSVGQYLLLEELADGGLEAAVALHRGVGMWWVIFTWNARVPRSSTGCETPGSAT